MSGKEEAKKEQEKKVPPEKERTFVYTLLRVIACIGVHTIFPVKYYHKERYELNAPYITMSNHQSACDPIILAYPCKKYEVRFVGKKELNLNKFVEKVLAKLHMITVDRHNSDMAAMRLCAKTLRDGYVLGIFPEGTRHHEGQMEQIESGTSMIVLRSKAPIIPIYIDRKLSLFKVTHLVVGDPVPADDLLAEGINTETCEKMNERLRETYRTMIREYNGKKS